MVRDNPAPPNTDIMRGLNDIMILFLLLHEPSYGYEISRQIREKTQGGYVIRETTLYSVFSRLENTGCIESFSGTVSMGRPRTYYRITDAGRTYYRQKCQEWQEIRSLLQPFIEEE
ncbi:MAG: PadR family transcriptional regulator [Clostridia bacterium]|nr:PadR family transcriptional regulator [Clostridia bacterium]NCC75815.1 PadR family transcriptional regulator [Clostridia bacterium]